jgi:excinuclease UvrABC ATPase subunit
MNNIDLDVCPLCKGEGYLKLPIGIQISEGFLAKTTLVYKKCPACQGHKRNIFKFPFSLEACEWLEDK